MITIKKLDGQDTLDEFSHLQGILAAGRRIRTAMDSIDLLMAARLGVHPNDLRCLRLLEEGSATPGEIAAHTGLTSGSVTALVDRLEASGTVERCRSTADRRSVEIAMTECRLAQMRAIITEIEGEARASFAALEPDKLAEASRVLGHFVDVLDSIATRIDPANRPR